VCQLSVGSIGEQGDGLCEVTDRFVALFDKPERQARFVGNPLAQAAAGNGTDAALPRQKGECPGRVLGWCSGKVGLQCSNLFAGAVGFVEFCVESGEELHVEFCPAPAAEAA